jgi:hypothetical protein
MREFFKKEKLEESEGIPLVDGFKLIKREKINLLESPNKKTSNFNSPSR